MNNNMYFNASLSCIDLGNIKTAMEEINHSQITSLHYDVVDGKFNECFIFGDHMLRVFRSYTQLPINVHLACYDPLPYIKPMINNGANYITIHYESKVDILQAFSLIRQLGAKPVLAFRCDSEVPNDFIKLSKHAEWVLKLCVHPGFSGQVFHQDALCHIEEMSRQLKLANLKKQIEVDGNINTKTINDCAKAGATIFTGGSSGLFQHSYSLNECIEQLKQAIQTGG